MGKTKSSLFLMPILTYETGKNCREVLWTGDNCLFNNAYIGIEEPKYTNKDEYILALRFNWAVKNGKKVVEEFYKHENEMQTKFEDFKLVHSYDPDNTSVIMVYEIPEKYRDIYNIFIRGKYSWFPDKYKKHCLKFNGLTGESKMHKILYKSLALKLEMERNLGCNIPDNAELYDPPYLHQEIFNEDMKTNKFQMKMFNI